MKKHKKITDDYGYVNETSSFNLPMIIGGSVLVVIIIVLCILLWQLLHQKAPQTPSFPDPTTASDNLINQGVPEKDPQDNVPIQSEEPESDEAQIPEETQDESSDQSNGITMTFQDVGEIVTAKNVTNLRSEPSTTGENTVVAQLENGKTAKRTGINETTGWSRLEYEGAIVYASSRLLTTDLTAKPETEPQNSNTVTTAAGRTITFLSCDDVVSPKMEVNLRLEPSTNQGNDTVHCRLYYGQNVHRTGYDDASGWSRVEYDGKVLYVVTSYIFVVEEPTE